MTFQKRRMELCEHLRERGISDERVLAAIADVPRERFVPAELLPDAYADIALPIGEGQTISQPYIVALMSEALHLSGEETVLEIGTGSGYQTAVLCALGAEVFSVEIVEELSRAAAERLRAIGCAAHLRVGDGAEGWPEHAPYARILAAAATQSVPEPLFEQLAPGGRLVVPLEEADGAQWIWVFDKTEAGAIEGERRLAVRFVPMTGRARKD